MAARLVRSVGGGGKSPLPGPQRRTTMIGYHSNDEVNRDRLDRLAAPLGLDVRPLDCRDDLAASPAGGLLIDLDSRARDDQRRLLHALLRQPPAGPVAVHSYDTGDRSEIDVLQRRGV